jgi:hypothetical protein
LLNAIAAVAARMIVQSGRSGVSMICDRRRLTAIGPEIPSPPIVTGTMSPFVSGRGWIGM